MPIASLQSGIVCQVALVLATLTITYLTNVQKNISFIFTIQLINKKAPRIAELNHIT